MEGKGGLGYAGVRGLAKGRIIWKEGYRRGLRSKEGG
jgi:hypothetical protein